MIDIGQAAKYKKSFLFTRLVVIFLSLSSHVKQSKMQNVNNLGVVTRCARNAGSSVNRTKDLKFIVFLFSSEIIFYIELKSIPES